MSAWYNEIDPLKAEVLREAIRANAIAPGDVDERSIADVQPGDIAHYAQCHFFAGGGFWSLALRYAGWPDNRQVWTGSCPCPSFSAAGKGAGFSDPRHLWPDWVRLIAVCRPPVVFGEQVAAAIGHGWLDLVHTDLEAQNYAVGAAVLGACSVGAPHIRQRLFFCAESEPGGSQQFQNPGREGPGIFPEEAESRERLQPTGGYMPGAMFGLCPDTDGRQPGDGDVQRSGELGLLAKDCGTGDGPDSEIAKWGTEQQEHGYAHRRNGFRGCCDSGYSLDSERTRLERHLGNVREWRGPGWLGPHSARSASEAGATGGFWADCDWWHGRDEKYRPIGPGLFPLAHGSPARVGRLRLYGDGIVVQAAQAFIESYLGEVRDATCEGQIEENDQREHL